MMLPPMVDAVDSGGPNNNQSVTFEPLPDISAIRRQNKTIQPVTQAVVITSNCEQLRPKVVKIGHERFENDDEIEYLTDDSSALQERVKLEKLLCEFESL